MSEGEIYVRIKSNKFILIHTKGSERRQLGSFRQRDLAPIVAEESPPPPEGELSEDIGKVLAKLALVKNDEVGQAIIELVNKLTAFQALMGRNGPGESGVLFDNIQNSLLTTYRKVKRMNDLAVKHQSSR